MGEKDSKQKTKDPDEWSHIGEFSQKIEIADASDVGARTTLGKELENATKEEQLKNKSEVFKDQMSNTNQYLKFINAHLAERKSKLERLKEEEKRFKEEIAVLQNANYQTEGIASIIANLEGERDVLKEKLEHQLKQIEDTKQQIVQKDQQITQIKKEFVKADQKNKSADPDPISIIKEELARLGVDDSSKLLKAVNSLAGLVNSKNQKLNL
jgi:chromosome segregation ATPase